MNSTTAGADHAEDQLSRTDAGIAGDRIRNAGEPDDGGHHLGVVRRDSRQVTP